MSVDSALATIYRPPIAFLPASTALPAPGDSPVDPALLRPALSSVVKRAAGLLDRLQNGVVAFGQIESAVAELDDALAVLAAQLSPPMQPLQNWVQPNSDRRGGEEGAIADRQEAEERVIADFGPLLAEACAIYDSYFGVVRVSSLTLWQLTGQVVATSRAILCDLPYTLLDRTQIVMLVGNTGRMLTILAQRLSLSPDNAASQPAPAQSAAAAQRAGFRQCWQQNEADSSQWSQTVAFYRWKVGHHFFDLCTIFCGDALRQAHTAIAAGNESAALEQFALADSLLRGTTAAMWYAGDFPANLYRDYVRPSMVMPGKTSGFSGDQNADYNRMKAAKDRLKEFLSQNYGPTLAALPTRLRSAFMNFHEADIVDSEHHLIIAAHKVGTDQSLAQKEWQAELPDHIHRQKAVDVLREMAESKRREFSGV